MNEGIAVVTGAGSGIGRAVALAFAEDGYAVVAAGRRQHLLDELAAGATSCSGSVHAVATDVRDEHSVDALFTIVESTYGRVDVVFNNAGVGAPAVTIDELPVDTWREVIDTNVTGVFLCARAAFALMRRQSPQGGRIINNGSVSAYTPRPCTTPYTASKHAVSGITKSIALDGRPFDIVASQIDIGNAHTDISRDISAGILQANGDRLEEPMVDMVHVVDAVRYIAALPLSANVLNMTIMATKMPFVGRG